MTTSRINLTRITRKPKPKSCPACRAMWSKFTFDDGETVPFKELPDRFTAALMWGRCLCGEAIYTLDVSVIPDVPAGTHFVDDACWQADEPQLFEACLGMRSWFVLHHRNVREISLSSSQTGDFQEFSNCAWLDCHSFWPIALVDDPFDHATGILRETMPALLSMRWTH